MRLAVFPERTVPPVLPNFLIVGVAKCGTTSLYFHLRQHPEVYLSPVKEPEFFSSSTAEPGRSKEWSTYKRNAVSTFDEYCRLFRGGAGSKAVGEASVMTFFYAERTIPAIRRYLGDPRIVIILRDPVERAYSSYTFRRRDGREDLSFPEALFAEEQGQLSRHGAPRRYRAMGMYADRVRVFQANFSRVQVLLYDDLKKDAAALARSLYAFLDVDTAFIPDTSHRHNPSGIPRWPLLNEMLFYRTRPLHAAIRVVGGGIFGLERWTRLRERLREPMLRKSAPIDSNIECRLRQYYRDDILKLQGYINRDLSAWLTGKRA